MLRLQTTLKGLQAIHVRPYESCDIAPTNIFLIKLERTQNNQNESIKHKLCDLINAGIVQCQCLFSVLASLLRPSSDAVLHMSRI